MADLIIAVPIFGAAAMIIIKKMRDMKMGKAGCSGCSGCGGSCGASGCSGCSRCGCGNGAKTSADYTVTGKKIP